MLIPLYKSAEATVIDDADWDLVSGIRWTLLTVQDRHYATGVRKGEVVLLHRLIMKAPTKFVVSHEDGDGLNNRRYNLRLATRKKVTWSRVVPGKTGIFKQRGKWGASIEQDGRFIVLGYFDSQHEAMQARDYFSKHTGQGFGGLHGVDLAGFDPLKLRPTARRIIAAEFRGAT